jgi:DNA repair photolyase
VPVGILVAPIIPALTDHEMERIMEAAVEMDAVSAAGNRRRSNEPRILTVVPSVGNRVRDTRSKNR